MLSFIKNIKNHVRVIKYKKMIMLIFEILLSHLVSQTVNVLRRRSSDKDSVVFSQLTSGRAQKLVTLTEDF